MDRVGSSWLFFTVSSEPNNGTPAGPGGSRGFVPFFALFFPTGLRRCRIAAISEEETRPKTERWKVSGCCSRALASAAMTGASMLASVWCKIWLGDLGLGPRYLGEVRI